MSVGGVGRKGRSGGAGSAGGPSGGGPAGGTGKASSTFRVEPTGNAGTVDALVGPSGAAGSGNVGAAGAAAPADAITAQALDIARMVKSGQIGREEATKRLISEVLQKKLRMKSTALSSKLSDIVQDDPRLNQLLERLWSKG